MKWNGAVAVITGASRGIGREVTLAAARRGARVGLLARSTSELDAVLAEAGGQGAVATADIGVREEVEAALAALTAELGPIDILVNNAGAGSWSAVADTDVEVYERLMRLNYLGTVYATKAVLPSMLDRGRGHIVNVGSIAGRIGAPFEAAYSASKFAVSGFTECLAVEVHSRGVGVSMVNPGPVQTDFFDARGVPYARKTPKPVPASDVADAVIAAVEKDRLEQFVPRFLGGASRMRALLPGQVYRWGSAKAFKDELGTR
ncbi:MAG: 3-oxoacyl-[acyl-carrier protein] reductase [Frankiales bacterium]|jgi:3-oxoacyl-[acyl-carrier protein] reductase|nr:3-oxoacyl-[acyl-carrier protein] reductase [Frankiales bacterium]